MHCAFTSFFLWSSLLFFTTSSFITTYALSFSHTLTLIYLPGNQQFQKSNPFTTINWTSFWLISCSDIPLLLSHLICPPLTHKHHNFLARACLSFFISIPDFLFLNLHYEFILAPFMPIIVLLSSSL
jgi:hypothetical protein